LVTGLAIESIKLLTKPPRKLAKAQNYVELELDGLIQPVIPMVGTIDLLFKGG
jgi:hypothetical protein